MQKEINLLDKYDKNKPLWECMTGKEVKQLAADLAKEISKLRREVNRWSEKKDSAKHIRETHRIAYEIKWRKERSDSLGNILRDINSQISNWFATTS